MDLGERLQNRRKRHGLTQRELAESAGVSVSLIRKIEQGEREDARIATLRRLAVGLDCPLTALLGPAPIIPGDGSTGALWVPTRDALAQPADDDAMPVPGLEAALAHATRLYHDNEYGGLAQVLPGSIQDGNAAPPLLRSRVLQLTGSVLVQTRQLEPARLALNRSLTDAESAGNALDAASAVITLCWLLIVAADGARHPEPHHHQAPDTHTGDARTR
ncbi:helix-turn-helix domain-containing protein [Nocardia sp. CNY236]|uniref:helix-turn-helix domain-containing protein n=1 Tax=Nocardia sp. CNY236 TaxID=1169152 RepID=UPI0009DFB2F0|nr:helix-turn-helix domain-containing protein [Nocardia sp. CNY236]